MTTCLRWLFVFLILSPDIVSAQQQVSPDKIDFVRQGVRRFIFDETHKIHLASMTPDEVIGMPSMYPVRSYGEGSAEVRIADRQLVVASDHKSETAIWFGGFNPFATYTIHGFSAEGNGAVGFEFSDNRQQHRFIITVEYAGRNIRDVRQRVLRDNKVVVDESIRSSSRTELQPGAKLILQMLGSGLTLFVQDGGMPAPIGQSDFNKYIDVRRKDLIHSFQSSLHVRLNEGNVRIDKIESALTSGMGLADIRAITYENGEPLLEQGRLWYTMTIRGRALPHHLQGVFSLNPTVFDLRFEGAIVFDQGDGLLRNEVASHIFFDRTTETWRGLTTGFSSFANPGERKQLFAVTSKRDPRFGFSVMNATPAGIIGDYEDPHILYDSTVRKWRLLTCVNENKKGYRTVLLESEKWDRDYRRLHMANVHDATGVSIQRIGNKRYCFSGSAERKVFIYSYPELNEVGTLKMDLPPWDSDAGTRIWPNVVALPEGYPFRYVALMMDRYKYPGIEGNHWSYGAVYLYHGNE